MIRTHLVRSLYEKLLGPENGPEEIVEQPYAKYQIGILESCFRTKGSGQAKLPEDPSDKAFFDKVKPTPSDDDLEGDKDVLWPDTELELGGSFTLGLSFVIKGESPKIRVCNTWGRYNYVENLEQSLKNFKRKPNFYLTDWLDVDSFTEKGKTIKLVDGKNGSVVTVVFQKGEVELNLRSRKIEDGKWTVQVFLVNKTQYADKTEDGIKLRQKEIHRIFQPQIRIKNDPDSEIVDFSYNSDDKKEILSFSQMGTKVRGFQCGAIWKEIDPESYVEDDGFRSFSWKDAQSKIIPKEVVDEFTCPDIRTDFLPTYTILQPEKVERQYDADYLSKQWSPDKINEPLEPLITNYENWISEQNKILDDVITNFPGSIKNEIHEAGLSRIQECKDSLDKIKSGIEFVCNDERARLAFCLMNIVMSEKRKNDTEKEALKLRKDGKEKKANDLQKLNWREFQMAFILQSLRGVAGEDQNDRNISDVLWYPTGGGKTEAYLGITIFTIAYRRLLPDNKLVDPTGEKLNSDGGVAVLSRYTLRLLTIQQFQRALGALIVADIKRVKNWLPENHDNFVDEKLNEKYMTGSLWGHARFSLGLWIGGDATPTRFAMMKGTKGIIIPNAEGKLLPYTHKEKASKYFQDEQGGDPAQVHNCPVCGNILCIPADSLNSDLLKDGITWIVQTKKTIKELEAIPKENFDYLPSKSIRLEEKPTYSEISELDDGSRYVRVTMKLYTKTTGKPRESFDTWWQNFVSTDHCLGKSSSLASTSASFPGYFFLNRPGDNKNYDFAIFCTNKDCELNKTEWFEQTSKESHSTIPKPFVKNNNISTSVPISAFMIDEQVYARCPTFVIATSDKFANLPWDPRCASLFGNVDTSHKFFGYGRKYYYDDGMVAPILETKSSKSQRIIPDPSEFTKSERFLPPSLIIQDELHLIEGPLGSMVGIYEMPVDIMCRNGTLSPKYIASSATIKEADSQVGTIFRKKISTFPPPGILSSDNFFSNINEDPSCVRPNKAGRLYLGVCSAKSIYELPIKTCAILMSEIYKIKENPEAFGETIEDIDTKVDPYWTYVSYFSDLQLMSRFGGMYNDDIQRDVDIQSTLKIGSSEISGTETFEKGIRFFPITADKDIQVYGVSVYCKNNIGSISVALYDENKNLLKWQDKKETIVKGQNKFFSDDLIANISKGQKIFVGVKNSTNQTYFHTVATTESWLHLEQKPDDDLDFPSSIEKPTLVNTDAIRIQLSGKRRSMSIDKLIQLSSETKSNELPIHLENLQKRNNVDALLTSPVFGTGIDVDRLGLMNIMNQPKTTSSYIQATGRVGRNNPGLVITWLRARRARDLDHYENFVGYHRLIHSQVEPVTANPFSKEALDLSIGPIMVSLLRNADNVGGIKIPNNWINKLGPEKILDHKSGNCSEINAIRQSLTKIASNENIPIFRMNNGFENVVLSQLKTWLDNIEQNKKEKKETIYGERNPSKPVEKDVVLGTPFHEQRGFTTVFKNTRNSLRDTEASAIFYQGIDQTSIRPSQFMTRYGPGSLLPSSRCSVVAPTVGQMIADLREPIGNFSQEVNGQRELQKIELQDNKMKKMLLRYNKDMDLDHIKIFSMPTNTSLNSAATPMKDLDNVYRTKIFPEWGICSKHEGPRMLSKITRDEISKALAVKCPICWMNSKYTNVYSTTFTNVRLVLACKNGHMSDIDWNYQIHHDKKCDQKSHIDDRVFEWNDFGGGDNIGFSCYGIWKNAKNDDGTTKLGFIRTKCGGKVDYLTLKSVDSKDAFACRGEYAEDKGTTEDCKEHPRLIMRNTMSLRSSIVLRSLLIKPRQHKLFYKLDGGKAPAFLTEKKNLDEYVPEWTPDILADKLQKNSNVNNMGSMLIRDIRKESRDTIEDISKKLEDEISRGDSDDKSLSQAQVLETEFDSLLHGIEESSSSGKFPVRWKSEYRFSFEAMPYDDIKVTTVQAGYSREISSGQQIEEDEDANETASMSLRIGKPVTKFNQYKDPRKNEIWHIADQNLGEGVFIHLDPKKHHNDEILTDAQGDWQKYHEIINKKAKELLKTEKNKTSIDSIEEIQNKSNPLFIWWHTLAHQIISQLSIDSGFSTTGISERVYCINKNGKLSSGILLYVSSPGTDGTLGGLTSLVDDDILPKIMNKALERLLTCSNDPVCSDRSFNFRRQRGAACQACIMVAETTCAYQNKFLDRNMVRGTLV